MELHVIKSVEEDWAFLMENIRAPRTVGSDWWKILSRRYGEEWRFYHTLSHVQHMMQLYHQWREKIAEDKAVVLAIFFHE